MSVIHDLAYLNVQKCFRCGIEWAPIWRKVHNVDVCNACGLYVKRVGPEALHDGGRNATPRGRPRRCRPHQGKQDTSAKADK
jgi:hypothetical protein